MKRALVLAIIAMLATLTTSAAVVVSPPDAAAAATTIVVDTSDDLAANSSDADKHTCTFTSGAFVFPAADGKCTLRRAVLEAGSRPASDQPITIVFNIATDGSDPGWDSVLDIAEVEINGSYSWFLDDIKNINGGLFTPSSVTIDGDTQPGGRANGPKVMIDTNKNNSALFGSSLQIYGTNHTITNLGFHGGGEVIVNGPNNTVSNNWMGLSNDGFNVELASTASSQAMRSMARGGITMSGADADFNLIQNNRIIGAFGRAIRDNSLGANGNVIDSNSIGMDGFGEAPSIIDCTRNVDHVPGQWYGGEGILNLGSDTTITNNRLVHLHRPQSANETPPIAFEIDGENNLISGNIVGIDETAQEVGSCGQGVLLAGHGTQVSGNTLFFTRNGFDPADIGNSLDSAILTQSFSASVANPWLDVRDNVIDGDDEVASTYHTYRFSNVDNSLKLFEPAAVTSISGTAVSGTEGTAVLPQLNDQCPNCTIYLYADDLDDRIEAKELLGTVTADGSGNWSTTLSRSLTGAEALRTQSQANSNGIFAGYGAKTTSHLSEIFYQEAPVECNGLAATVVIGSFGTITAGDDVIVGTNGADNINGLAGNDTICGGGGGDTIRGGAGVDTIFGEGGADIIKGGGGGDTINGGLGADDIQGQGGVDTIHGNEAGDTISGGGAKDFLYGDDGNDVIDGQNGGDEFFGGDGDDDMGGQTGPDIFIGGIGDDTMLGGDGNDRLTGNAGFDKCSGNTGGGDEAHAASCEQTPGIEIFF